MDYYITFLFKPSNLNSRKEQRTKRSVQAEANWLSKAVHNVSS
ncbi:hypothetical protein Barb6XT_02699 [Bacteroidales bacterium Barb6XT]|nr:hypothetical protein Barb6XT_02699 [Bacteroidales bacterium Barb6XT]